MPPAYVDTLITQPTQRFQVTMTEKLFYTCSKHCLTVSLYFEEHYILAGALTRAGFTKRHFWKEPGACALGT